MADFSEQWEGRTINGGFLLRQFLNGGEENAVFLTTYETRDAAIKLVGAEEASADAQLARWRAAQKLVHPNLIRILAMGRSELDSVAIVYVVTESAEEDLSQVLPDRPLTAAEARDMLEPTLSALDYIHQQGFVHAHLKPANIMAVENSVKISSDGICRLGSNDGNSSSAYDPPEHAQGVVSTAGDVWALGITLVEVLTQRRPVTAPAIVLPTDLPDPFAEIVRHCLVVNPAERWTLSQISKQLGHREVPISPAATRRRGTPVGVMILLAAVVLLVVGVIVRESQTEASAPPVSKESVKVPEVIAKPEVKPKTSPGPEKPRDVAKAPESKLTQPATKSGERKSPDPSPPAENSKPAGEVVATEMGDQPMPDIPASGRRTIHGKVTVNVRVDVDPSGAVRDVKLDSPAASKYFTSRTLTAVHQWKFKPVSVNGSDSAQRWRIHFEFLTSGTKVQPKRLSP